MDEKTTRVKLEVIADKGNRCWLNGKITRDNPLTGHHIIPRRDGGKTTKQNIAPVCDQKHQSYNALEIIAPDLAEEIKAYLLVYRGNYDEEISNRIDYLMSIAERREHKPHHKTKVYQNKNKRHKRRGHNF